MSTEEELIAELLAEVRSDGDVVAGPTNLDRRAASTISRLSAEVQELREAVDEVDRLGLVIESAVRWSDEANLPLIKNLFAMPALVAAKARRRAALKQETVNG